MPVCNKCGKEKALDEFRVCLNLQYGREYRKHQCRQCEAQYMRVRYERNPEASKAASRKWVKEHPEHHNATKRAWYHQNKEHHKSTVRKRLYGLTPAQYQEMLSQHAGLCGICKQPFETAKGRFKVPCIDHCHVTGKVRGLLCSVCNSIIGFATDEPTRLSRAVSYLTESTLPASGVPSP